MLLEEVTVIQLQQDLRQFFLETPVRTRGQRTVGNLPEEVLLAIFNYLDHASLKSVRLVSRYDSMILQLANINHYCSHWKYVVETPRLWNWARLKVQSSNCLEILESSMLDFVSGIRVCWWERGCPSTVTRIFTGILAGDLPQLRKLDLDNSSLGSVEPRLLQVWQDILILLNRI